MLHPAFVILTLFYISRLCAQDAHELLCQLIDQLNEELSADASLSDVRSPSVDNFQFSIEKTIHCDRSVVRLIACCSTAYLASAS